MQIMDKRRMRTKILATAVVLAASSVAAADTLNITGDAGTFDIDAAPIDQFVFGNSSPGSFNNQSLEQLHDRITAANGIETDGKVTFIAGNVTGTTGPELAFFTLIDREFGSFSALDSSLGFESRVSSEDAMDWRNETGDAVSVGADPDDGNGFEQRAAGAFAWDKDGKGDAFAWSGLEAGDSGDVTLSESGDDQLTGRLTEYQVLTWTGQAWEVAASGSFGDGFNVQFAVVPLPLAAWIGIAGLAGAGVARRRIARG